MRLGVWLNVNGATLDQARTSAADAARAGYQSLWVGELGNGWDPLTLLSVIGPSAPGLELGTAVVRTYPRHPIALAAQATTINAAVGSRLVLGLGPAHGPIVESQYGMSFDRPGTHTREYLEALRPLLSGEPADVHGEQLTARGRLDGLHTDAPVVLVSALGPRMVRIAGELGDGIITTWASPTTLEADILPRLRSAAERAGRTAPRVVAQAPVTLTAKPDETRQWVNEHLGGALELPSYRRVFEREGYASTADAVILGDEATIAPALRRFADVGVTDLLVTPLGPAEDSARTLAAVPALLG